MNVFLWVIQILLAFHTAIGAVWKFYNTEQGLPSLQAIPHIAWLGIGVIELLCSLALLIPLFYRPMGVLAPYSAIFIATVMLVYCVLHLMSGDSNHGQLVYWLVVALVCAFVAYGRLVLISE